MIKRQKIFEREVSTILFVFLLLLFCVCVLLKVYNFFALGFVLMRCQLSRGRLEEIKENKTRGKPDPQKYIHLTCNMNKWQQHP